MSTLPPRLFFLIIAYYDELLTSLDKWMGREYFLFFLSFSLLLSIS